MRFRHLAVLVLFTAWTQVALFAAEAGYALKTVMIADEDAKALALTGTEAGSDNVIVKDIPFLDSPAFRTTLAPFLGRTIDSTLLQEISQTITAYLQKQDRVIVHLGIPTPQDIGRGGLRLTVRVGQFNALNIKGNRYFSRKLLEQKLGIKPGDEVRLSTLEEAVNWANTNPFRHIQVMINPLQDHPGKADLLVKVDERRPWRLTTSYDNTGVALLGRNHYTAGLQFGNLWGQDHQGSYQFVTTDDLKLYQVHAIDYRIPLPWRHTFQINAAYARVRPSFEDDLFNQDGESIITSLRYTIPSRRNDRTRTSEIFAGIDFKQSNNDLEFGGGNADRDSTQIIQASLGFSKVLRDTSGAWVISGTAYFSPGNLTSQNSDRAFSGARFGAPSRYAYGSFALQRLQTLSYGWELFSRATVQISANNLLSNEQLTIGGVNTVRGYHTNVFASDEGLVLNNDLQSPVWKRPFSRFSKSPFVLETRGLLFLDIGRVDYKHQFNFDSPFAAMASIGTGLRMNVGTNLNLNFDYGWQLTHLPPPPRETKIPPLGSQGHIKVVLAF